MADYIYVVQLDIPPEFEKEFNRVYDTQHVPNLLTVPGVRSCTRYKLEVADTKDAVRYIAIYEIDSPDIPQSAAWHRESDKGDWVTKIRPHVTRRIRGAYRRIN
ncbi:MAG: hypothetical protein HYY00_01975 [Chloroflexi bacterium]|nr:hypothetical protein [Chloroflexota bacterium]